MLAELTLIELIVAWAKVIGGVLLGLYMLYALVVFLFRKPPNNDDTVGGGYIGYSHIHEPEKWD